MGVIAQMSNSPYVTDFILSGIRKHPGQKSENREAYNKERGPWTLSNIILKILHVPEVVSDYKAKYGNKYIIRATEIYKMHTGERRNSDTTKDNS